MRWLVLAVALSEVANLGLQKPPAPSRPSFAGTWQLDNLKDGPWSPFGSWFTATQDKNSLVFDVHTILTMDDYPGSPASVTVDSGPRRLTLPFQGETRITYPHKSSGEGNPPGLQSFAAVGEPTTEVARGHWDGDQLVVVTHTEYLYTSSPGLTPSQFKSEITDRMALSLDESGRLVVETLRISDFPDQLPKRDVTPSPRVTKYHRKP